MTSSEKTNSFLLQLPNPLDDEDVYNRDAAKWLLHRIEFQRLRDEYIQERRALEGFRWLFKQFEDPRHMVPFDVKKIKKIPLPLTIFTATNKRTKFALSF